MSETERVYDSIDLQLMALRETSDKNLNPADLATPEMVHFILQREVVHLTELKAQKTEIADLRNANSRLKGDRESLRIAVAQSGERETFSWIEIPVSILSGFAINKLTSDPKDGFGWVLLIMTIIILLFLRLPQLRQLRTLAKKEDEENG